MNSVVPSDILVKFQVTGHWLCLFRRFTIGVVGNYENNEIAFTAILRRLRRNRPARLMGVSS